MKISPILLALVCSTSLAMAETLHLTDGRSITGSILEKDAKSVQIDVNGMSMTYFADEIKDIDGQPFRSAVTGAAKIGAPAGGGAEKNKRDLILKFIDVFGTKTAMTQNLDAMMDALPDGAEKTRLKGNIKVDEIIDRLIPVYDKQFSAEELETYIEFYSSPQGRKLVSSIAVIMRESITVSTQYFQEKFPELKSADKN